MQSSHWLLSLGKPSGSCANLWESYSVLSPAHSSPVPSHFGCHSNRTIPNCYLAGWVNSIPRGLQESLETIGQNLGEFLASSSRSRIFSPSQEGPWSRGDPWVPDTQCPRNIRGSSAAQPGTESGFCMSGSCRGTLEVRERGNPLTPDSVNNKTSVSVERRNPH